MHEAERRQRVISSTPHLTPEEIATRSFGTKVRGFSESEVRTFLKRVSEELVAAKDRERELEAAIDDLEEQLRAPRPLSEQELLDALGEETARLLRSAREASDDIRSKAEDYAARIVEEARQDADNTRREASEVLAARSREADTKVTEMIAASEARAAEIRDAVTAEAESLIEAARHHGREMIEEAKHARERVLGDLVRRRALLHHQIEELRGGRDQLLDAYRTVKRTFLEATEALAQVEVRAAVERAEVPEPADLEAEIAAEIETLESAHGERAEGDEHTDAHAIATEIVDLVEAAPDTDADREAATRLADVDSLFARLRAGHNDEPLEGPASPEAPATAVATTVVAPAEIEEAATTEPDIDPESGVERLSASEWRAVRGKAVNPLLSSLVKRAKRTAQDDQNALLDAVRRHKGRPSSSQVLPDADAALASWVGVIIEPLNTAYSAGRIAAGGESSGAPGDLASEAAEAIAGPLRERLSVAIDSAEAGDTGGLVERIGARYREWKNESLERALGEILAFVWARGVYDAVPDDAVLRWIAYEEGRCSDCDDNALEPTTKGKPFPTGQPYPPAHAGCKCLLVPADRLDLAASSA